MVVQHQDNACWMRARAGKHSRKSAVNNSVLVKRGIDVDMPFQNSPVWMG